MKSGKRSSWQRYLSSPVTLVVLAILIIVLARATANINRKASASSIRLSQAQAEFAKLQERKEDLGRKVTLLSSDEGLESEIRAKYRAVKEGESVAVIVDDPSATTIQTTTTVVLPKLSWWGRLLQKIGL